MNKSVVLPNNPQEKEELIKKIKDQIIKIAPNNTNLNADSLQKKAVLQERLKLINNCKQYSENRISNIQKIFKHYSTHLFRSGQKYDFDQIGYLNDHMIMERFFAFINDFKLNQIMANGQPSQLADRNDIILIFKKSSSNARNLDLPQFIACLERLFVFLFNQNQGYKAKQDKLKKEKQQRKAETKKREKLKLQRERAIKAARNQSSPPVLIKNLNPEVKKPKEPKEPTKENDEMMKDMMKNFQIVNPNDSINKTVQEIKQQQPQQVKLQQSNDYLYVISDPQKIQSYMQRIGIDDKKQIQKKIRYFQKANYKYFEVDELNRYRENIPLKKNEQKGNQPLNLKNQLTSMHDQWKKDKLQLQKSNAQRFMKVSAKIQQRQVVKDEIKKSRVLSREKYEQKIQRFDERFTSRQINLMYPTARKRVAQKKDAQSSTVYYSLEMLHHSTPNQLPIDKIYPQRYVSSDPTDPIYLQEYGFTHNMGKKAIHGIADRGKSQLIQSTKRRAAQIQTQQAKRLSQLSVNLVQNHHYLQKFLERKW